MVALPYLCELFGWPPIDTFTYIFSPPLWVLDLGLCVGAVHLFFFVLRLLLALSARLLSLFLP